MRTGLASALQLVRALFAGRGSPAELRCRSRGRRRLARFRLRTPTLDRDVHAFATPGRVRRPRVSEPKQSRSGREARRASERPLRAVNSRSRSSSGRSSICARTAQALSQSEWTVTGLLRPVVQTGPLQVAVRRRTRAARPGAGPAGGRGQARGAPGVVRDLGDEDEVHGRGRRLFGRVRVGRGRVRGE